MKWTILAFSFMTVAFIVFINVLLYSSYSTLDKEHNIITIEKEKTEVETKLQEEILLWHAELGNKPNYRDAYLKLALLNWKLGRKYEARKFLDGALKLDPSNETAKEILEDFEE